MKPLKIEFAAFGSYPEKVEVDFTALYDRGLFVISGDTGAGKTTVFDAMSFALFGKPPGKPADDIRSHHATDSTKTYAQFTFEAGGAVYVVRQTPRFEKLKQDGSGTTTVNRTASLKRVDGDQAIQVADKATYVDTYIKDLIGLTDEQFRRVMVLPQGEVQKFLFDDSGSREQLLKQLFGGDVFEAITEALKNGKERAEAEVSDVETSLRDQIVLGANAVNKARQELGLEPLDESEQPDRSLLGEWCETLRSDAAQLKKATTAARKATDRVKAEASAASAAAHRFDQAEGLREALRDLEEKKGAVEAAATAAVQSAAARPVIDAAARAESARGLEADAVAAAAETFGEIRKLGAQADLTFADSSPAEVAAVIVQGRADLNAHKDVLEEHRDAASAAGDAEGKLATWERNVGETKERAEATQLELTGIQEELQALSETPTDTTLIDAECKRLSTALEHLERRDDLQVALETANEAVSDADLVVKKTMAGYLRSEAPRMAAQLEDGEPCVVCGATEHPRPAKMAGDGPVVSSTDVENAQEELRKAQAEQNRLVSDLGDVKVQLGPDAEGTAVEISSRFVDAQERLADLEAALEKQVQLTELRDGVANRLEALELDAARLSGEEGGLRQNLQEAAERLKQARAAAAGLDAAALAEREVAIADLERLRGSHQKQVEEESAAIVSREQADEVLAATIAETDFGTVEEAQDAHLGSEEEQKAFDEQQALRTSMDEAAGALKGLQEEGIPDSRPEAEALSESADEAEEKVRELEERNTRVQDSLATASKALEVFDTIETDSASVREDAKAAAHAYAVCQGRHDVNLLRWVLAQQLDQVAEVASEHLRQMTNGRYTIRRAGDKKGGGKKGLDLTVEDAHTGRNRVPASLSGGEQFQASLALALGLADVLSRAGSTRSHGPEALFIDEGFGSLDQAALVEAIGTLHGLQEQGRMVGVITHVEAMKERLHPGIVVKRRADGRGSELTVNP